MRPKNEQLVQLAELGFLVEYQRMQPILAKEAMLRKALKELDIQESTSHSTISRDVYVQLTGTDVTWRNWVSRTRRSLNNELSEILAQKAVVVGRLQAQHGKKEAVLRIIAQRKKSEEKKKSRKDLEDTAHRSY